MELDDFARELYTDHARTVGTFGQEEDIRFCALALAGEAGEVANVVKKEWRDRKDLEGRRLEESADVLVYLLLLCNMSGWTFERLLEEAHKKHQQFMEKWDADRNN